MLCWFVDADNACKNSGNANDTFLFSHPYKCDKYIECYSLGQRGRELGCFGEMFNPDYTDNSKPCASDVPKCTQSP